MKKTLHPNYYATRRDSNCYRQPPQQHGGCTPGFGYRYRKPGYISNHRLDRPPERNSSFRLPNFVVQLHLGRRVLNRDLNRDNVESLIGECSPKPENFTFYPSDDVAATLDFLQWTEARDAVVWFWELRISGGHDFTPELISNVLVPSDRVELEGRLRSLFRNHVKGLMEGKEVKRWVEEKDRLSKEIVRLERLLKRPLPIRMQNEHAASKKGLDAEKNLIEGRLKEFGTAMECILKYLEENRVESGEEDDVHVFRFDGRLNWKKILSLIVRECRRLEEGLPIYAYRREILRNIHHQQIMVLVGETGSGKSTQIVQFLADSGIGADQSIVCTQPRKIAAKSLAQRVQEESSGCYADNSIDCYSTFSSSHKFDSKITFMTDHCLLQHYMSDKNLSGVSCIIVDEAHERSLNTDLLLALIKYLLSKRVEMRLIIMSATADAKQLSDYFYGCGIFHVLGRNFPVEVKYIPSDYAGRTGSAVVASYVSDVVRTATEIHKSEKEGTILAFLTSQIDVESACEKFNALHANACAKALPLHGKLSSEEQCRVFQNSPGKRKVIFSTNLAETSLTIPGVKYVIDSGLVKESRFDPGSGMNVLKVCWISRSSANQRAGRAGRTEPGRCYRLYSEADYQSMELNQEPEIRRVHLGVAVLRILALGVKNVQDFDFVDAPSPSSIDMAIRNLIQLDVIKLNNNIHELTHEGRYLVRMGIEPRLGKLILGCFPYGLGKVGIVLAATMANASSIFFRVGNEGDKRRSDCYKVKFCHCDGDLFTLLSVYKEWEALPHDRRKNWCRENSINAKSLRRCQDTILELESCLERELGLIVPSYWRWDPHRPSDHDNYIKRVILSSLAENVAMYSGCTQLGYEVAQSGKHVQLHPSCSLLVFTQRPSWVVFSELLSSVSTEYLFCVSAFDFQSLHSLSPPPLFNASRMEERKLQVKTLTGLGPILLKKFCGKGNSNLLALISRIRKACMDERTIVEVDVDENHIQVYATSHDMDTASTLVNDGLEDERKRLRTECMEKYLYHGSNFSSPVALFGSGAEIKHLELEKHSLSVDVHHPNINAIDDKELLMFFEKNTSGCICAVHKFTGLMKDAEDREKWGRLTFLSPDAAKRAAELDGEEFCGLPLKIVHSHSATGGDKTFSFPAVTAKISWPRRPRRNGILKCNLTDVDFILRDFYNLAVGGRYIRCARSNKYMDSIVIYGLDNELPEAEIVDVLKTATSRMILDFFFVRGDAVENPPCSLCEEALLKEISPLMPKRIPHISSCRVQVFPPEPKDSYMKALITFDGRLHLEAAQALENIEGKVLRGCQSWQKIKCQREFHSSLIFPAPVYRVIREQLEKVFARFSNLEGFEWNKTANGSHRVKITANATKTVAEVRRPLEELLRGKSIDHESLSPAVLQLILSREGFNLKNSIQEETGTYILFDRYNQNLRMFGSPNKIALAEQKLIQSLLSLHEEKQLEIHLRGRELPHDLMKQVVKNFGPDLHGLKEKVPGADLNLNTRHQIIFFHGNKELKPRVEKVIFETVRSSHQLVETPDTGPTCPICLCEIDDGYQLEGCRHLFCRECLMEQCDSAIKNQDSFPICCAHPGCGDPILLTDFRTLLSNDKLEELFRASLGAFVASSAGTYRFCPTPDCPSIYQVADPNAADTLFVCGACYSETCTRCHLENHPYLTCEQYREFKDDPDSSLLEWCKGKDQVKSCSACGHVIEKVDGCNHVECKCGKHVCWVCLEFFTSSDECYDHLRAIHKAIV